MFTKKNEIGISLLILFFLSRLPFINTNDVFFDSKEYLTLFANSSFYHAIVDGHTPIHEGYIILFWPVFQVAKLILPDPGYMVILGQILLATVTVYCFYKLVTFISDRNVGLLSSIIISLVPLFWITNVTITLEISYLSFFFLSLYFLTLYLSKNKNHYLFLSFSFFCFAFMTYSAVLLWVPLYLLIAFYKKRKQFMKIFIYLSLSLSITLLLRLLIFSAVFHETPLQLLHNLYLGNAVDAGNIQNNIEGLIIRIRNFIPVLRSYTSLVFIMSIFSLIICSFKNKQYFFIGLVWIIPILFTNQWWDSLLMGRYSITAGFGFAFLTGYLINKYRFLAPIVILYLFFVSLPALTLLRSPTPYMKEEAFVKTLPKDSLLIESHFALPQLVNCCEIKILGVNRQDVGNEKIKSEINTYFENKKPVFVSSAAVSDPYGLYTGPYLHPLSLSYTNKFELESWLTEYTWKKYHVIDEKDNLIIYRITNRGNSTYPEVMNMRNHYRRLDYYDPFSKLGSFLYNKFKRNLSL